MFTVGEDSCAPTKKPIGIASKEAQTAAPGLGCCSGEDGCSHEADFAVDQMEFWGTEVSPGKPQVNEPGDDSYVHVSQVALGPSKDGKTERVVVRVESGGKNVVLGTLSSGKVDQMTLDLIFDREFKLSHTSTSCNVFFCGYRTDKRQDYDEESEEDEEEDEGEDDKDDEPVPTAVLIKENGTVSVKEDAKASKKQLKVVEKVEKKGKKGDTPKASLLDQEADEGEESDEDDDEDDDDSEDDDEEADKAITMDFGSDDYDEEDDSEFEVDDEGGMELNSDDSDEDDSDEDDSDEDDEDDEDDDEDEDEDDVTAELGKKRTLQGSAKKSPGDKKKPRLDTPAKPGGQSSAEYWESLIVAGGKGLITTPGKKGAKGAADTKSTPVASKKETKEAKGAVAKTPQKTPGKETTVKTPKTATPASPSAGESTKKLGDHHCAECKRNFASDSALSQHASAKHKK